MTTMSNALFYEIISANHDQEVTFAFLRELCNQAGLSENQAEALQASPKFRRKFGRLIQACVGAPTPQSAIMKRESVIALPARDAPLDPRHFFSTGTHMWHRFRDRILPDLEPVESTPARNYRTGLLRKKYADAKIRPALPAFHLASWEDIANFMRGYPEGTPAGLPDKFLCYMQGVEGEILAVPFRWAADLDRWAISAWELDEDGPWDKSYAVFYPALSSHNVPALHVALPD
jgi:hypothetical protein